MSRVAPGAAREVAPGRLANFEDAELDVDSDLLLPPRPPAGSDPTALPDPAVLLPPRPRRQAREQQPPAAQASDLVDEPDLPAGPDGSKGPQDRMRASNVHIPVGLLPVLEAMCRAEGLSHGEVIIVAVEASYPRLRELIQPATTAGGSLFAARRSRALRGQDGPVTPLNYRLRQADFDTLDRLADQFGASSRTQLITAALGDYFRDQTV